MENISTTPSSDVVQDGLDEIRRTLNALQSQVSEKRKDRWDKAGVVAQFLSGVVLATVGILVALFGQKLTEKQVVIADRAQFSSYVGLIAGSSDENKRAALVSALDLGVPDQRVRIASHYVVSDPSYQVRRAAMGVLATSADGKEFLRALLKQGRPEEDRVAILTALGQQPREIKVRIPQVDDFGYVFVNGVQALKVDIPGSQDWFDVTPRIKAGVVNKLVFRVDNGLYGGWNGRFQISAAGQLLDSDVIGRDSCPCNAPAFKIEYQVVADPTGRVVSVTEMSRKYFTQGEQDVQGP